MALRGCRSEKIMLPMTRVYLVPPKRSVESRTRNSGANSRARRDINSEGRLDPSRPSEIPGGEYLLTAVDHQGAVLDWAARAEEGARAGHSMH
jgi:hypothetical protein